MKKKIALVVFLIVIMVSGFVLASVANFGLAAFQKDESSKDLSLLLAMTEKTGNGIGDSNGSSNSDGNGNSATKDNHGNSNGNNVNGSGGNGNGNGGEGNGNTGTNIGNNGNGNGNNVNNGNGNNGNANGRGNGNGNSYGNNGNGNNGNGNNGSNGNSGNNNGDGDTGNGDNGNSNNGNNGNNSNTGNNDNGNGNNGANGDNGNNNNGNGNGNKPTPTSSPTSTPTPTPIPVAPTPSPTQMPPPNQNQNRFKVSGYILDSDGKGIAGAEIIFCVPDIVPAQFSDSSGYYEMNAPVGKYQVDVWPPFDSHYLFYEQKYLTVTSDIQKNITLPTGCRISGTITGISGAPVSGAIVWVDTPTRSSYYFCGWYSKPDGRYFVTAPAGTYILNLKPKTGLSFPTYTENNFVVNGNITKNIVLGSTQNPPTCLAKLSLSVGAKFLEVGSTLTVNGKLSDQNGTPLADKPVVLSYLVANSGVWVQIGSAKTDAAGSYSIEWLIPASGMFTLKVEWTGNSDYRPTSAITTLSIEASKNAPN